MAEIIPSILVKTPEEFEQMIRKIEPYAERAQLDIGDGVFVPNKTISGYDELIKINTPLKFDAHLMVAKPEDELHNWYKTKADRIIIHVETDHGHLSLIEQIRLNDRKVGLAINPDTRIEKLSEFVDSVDFVQFMTVHPGFYGGEFVESVVGKISEFHEEYPEMPIAVDGGINPNTARKVIAAGATILVAGSFIFKSPDIGRAMEELKSLINIS